MIPATPNGTNGVRLPDSQPSSPSTTNRTSTPILVTTMIALIRADSLVPRISSTAHSRTRTTAETLSQPPASGDFDNASGICTPKTLSSNWLRYSDQPTATAAEETPYSSSRHAATPIATSSPMVA